MSDNQQNVYIVTSGEYSDYHICRVFLDKKKAEIYCSLLGNAEVEEYVISDDAVSVSDYYIGYRRDSISILQDGSMHYDYGTFYSSEVGGNSVDNPSCEEPSGKFDSVDKDNIRWDREEYEKQKAFYDRPPWVLGAVSNMSYVPEDAIPECTITRTTKLVRNDCEPEKSVLRKQLIDLSNEVKYQLSHGVSHESIAKWLNNR